jgi:hypothetical protein
MNVLPGLRELRAPVAAGYMWLITAWLWLDHIRLIPESRPADGSWLARLWTISSALGIATLLTILTFVAYLLGSFLEIDIDNSRLNRVVPFVVRWRAGYQIAHESPTFEHGRFESLRLWNPPSIAPIEKDDRELLDQAVMDLFDRDVPPEILMVRRRPGDAGPIALQIANSFSPQGRHALAEAAVAGGQVSSQLRRSAPNPLWTFPFEPKEGFNRQLKGLLNYHLDLVVRDVMSEMPQLASRLLVKNKELYGRYDRFRSEASFRINVSIALLALLGTATYMADIPWAPKIALVLAEFVAAMLLFRQGLLRSISARDVIAQAIAIGEVESAYIRRGKTSASPTRRTAPKQAASSDGETRPEAQLTSSHNEDLSTFEGN